MNVKQTTHATAKISVNNFEAKPYDQSGGPALVEISLTETFAGDIDGTSTVRALQVRRDDGSASMVSLQRFIGRLDGREGTFVLQGSETIEGGKIKATWFVVPGSGTAALRACAEAAALKGSSGKALTERWTTGLNKAAAHVNLRRKSWASHA